MRAFPRCQDTVEVVSTSSAPFARSRQRERMSRISSLAVGRLVALCLLLTLKACSDRRNDKLAAAPPIEPAAQSATPVESAPPGERQQSSSPELSNLKQGPL